MKSALRKKLDTEVYPKLKEELGLTNDMTVPKIDKITINVGVGKGLQDKTYVDHVVDTVRRITGQQPVLTKAKKSLATFKIREGMVVGVKTTLRGERMYAFLEKLLTVAMPRIRDFRGVSVKGFDRQGNYSVGIKEHLIFPEINADEVEKIHGLEVVITTTAKDRQQGYLLLKYMGFPFNDELRK
ncbi:MAG: 50S ribosomal protein L5 [Patescibacteria group bacterium]